MIDHWWTPALIVLTPVITTVGAYAKIKTESDKVAKVATARAEDAHVKARASELEDQQRFRTDLLSMLANNNRLIADQALRITELERINVDQAAKIQQLLEHVERCDKELQRANNIIAGMKTTSY